MTLDNLLSNALKQLKSQVFTQSYTSTFHLLSIDLLIAKATPSSQPLQPPRP